MVIRDLLPFHDKPIVITLCKKTKRFAIVIACGTCDNENGHFNFKQNVIVEMRLWDKSRKIEVIEEGYPLVIRSGSKFEFEGGIEEEAKYTEEHGYLDNLQIQSL